MATKRKQHPGVKFVPLKTTSGATVDLAFSFNGIAQAERLTGLNLLKVLDFSNLDAQSYRALLYSAMLKANPDATLEEAGDLIVMEDLRAISDALLEAWTLSHPSPDPNVKPEAPAVE